MSRPWFNASDSAMRPSVMAVAIREVVIPSVTQTVRRKSLHHRLEPPNQPCSGA
jgi:hypothetical protein